MDNLKQRGYHEGARGGGDILCNVIRRAHQRKCAAMFNAAIEEVLNRWRSSPFCVGRRERYLCRFPERGPPAL